MSNSARFRTLAAAVLLGLTAGLRPAFLPAQEPGKVLLNLDKSGVAIRGYDPVAYFTEGKPVKGTPALSATHQQATYYFASREHLATFSADPARYVPQFGGYCGYGASRGYPANIDPEAFMIMDGRLILQNSQGVLRRWQEDPESYLRKADANWPAIVAKHGKLKP
jgi:YHS domain-containing protein